MKNMALIFANPHILQECRRLRWGLWQCPPFLVVFIGIITIVSMLTTYLLASRYAEEPEIAALVVIAVTLFLLIVGNIIISGFNRLAEAHHIKSEFIAIVSHQLRSPLSIFKWTLDTFEQDVRRSRDSADWHTSFQTLRMSTDQMVLLVNSLLEVSRIEAETVVLKREPVSLSELTRDALEQFRAYAHARNITIQINEESLIPVITGDPERMGMVIQNLLDNAIRYTGRSGLISVEIEDKGSFVRWAITDQGLGIAKDQQPYIFRKFFRAENAMRLQTHGSGVGLYIAKAIIEASGGSIGFSSEEGSGSRFWFTLPLSSRTL